LNKIKGKLTDLHRTLERWITFLNIAHEYSKDNLPIELATDENIKTAMKELEIKYF